MFQNLRIAGQQTWAKPEAPHNFGPAARERSETVNQLTAWPFDYVKDDLLVLVRYLLFLDFSPDISRNPTVACATAVEGRVSELARLASR
jgi:hypothetical protein